MNKELFVLPLEEIKMFGRENLTYGSLTDQGIRTMVKKIQKYSSQNIFGFDLGCGDGELIFHLAENIPNSVWEGVEISNSRVSMQKRDVCIWAGDMMDENFRPYNILHADNLCLSEISADKLEEKIAIEFQGIYITYRYPQNINFFRAAEFLEKVLVETTWAKHYIYFFKLTKDRP
jgi:hypothetical protein